MILLDTHVVLWLVGDDPRLGKTAIAAVAGDDDRRVSAMVSWEIAMNVDKKRLSIESPLASWLQRSFDSIEAREVPVTGAMALDAGGLRDGLHGDPCDRIMIATARALECPLLTADEKILDYAAAGHLKAIDARR